jgi:hypothetical protein
LKQLIREETAVQMHTTGGGPDGTYHSGGAFIPLPPVLLAALAGCSGLLVGGSRNPLGPCKWLLLQIERPALRFARASFPKHVLFPLKLQLCLPEFSVI